MDWTAFLELAPGLGIIVIAVLSGAGGSALLELIWKPRRDRRAAAALLYAEILQNSQMVLFWSELRKNTPRKIPSDFRMSTAAWQIAASRVGELPTPLLKKALLLYDHYQETNRLVAEYAETLDRLSPLPKGDPERKRLESHLNTILDVFNTGLDRSFELGKDVAEETVKIGRIREKKTPPRDFGADARKLVAERQDRIRRLEGMDDH